MDMRQKEETVSSGSRQMDYFKNCSGIVPPV